MTFVSGTYSHRTKYVNKIYQCCGPGSGRIRIHFGRLDPDPDLYWNTDPEVLKCEMFSFEDEDFSCSLGVLYGGLGISKLQFLIKKIYIFFCCKFFPIFGHQNRASGSVSGSTLTKNAGSGSGSAFKPMRIRNTEIKIIIKVSKRPHG